MSLLRQALFVTVLMVLGHCNLSSDDFDENPNAIIRRSHLKRALGYRECPENIPERSNGGNRARYLEALPKSVSDICDNIECPDFENLRTKGCGYGARKMLRSKWISTLYSSVYGNTNETPYLSLHEYTQGFNKQQTKMSRTAPVVFTSFSDPSTSETNFVFLSFYLGADYNDSPPVPLDTSVTIDHWDDTVIYYRAIGGNDVPSEETWEEEFNKLYEAVNAAGLEVVPNRTMKAAFTRPGYGQQRWEAVLLAR